METDSKSDRKVTYGAEPSDKIGHPPSEPVRWRCWRTTGLGLVWEGPEARSWFEARAAFVTWAQQAGHNISPTEVDCVPA